MIQLNLLGGFGPEQHSEGRLTPLPIETAQILDTNIDSGLKRLSDVLVEQLLAIGAMLNEMQASKGYQALGFPCWEGYLKSKRQYGRTYLSYLLKLGKAGDLSRALKMGLGGTQLIEYAKATDFPEKIQQLVDATWDSVKGASTRDLQARLREYVGDHFEEFKKAPPVTKALARQSRWKRRWQKQYAMLAPYERPTFLVELWEFLADVDA